MPPRSDKEWLEIALRRLSRKGLRPRIGKNGRITSNLWIHLHRNGWNVVCGHVITPLFEADIHTFLNENDEVELRVIGSWIKALVKLSLHVEEAIHLKHKLEYN